jgi:arginase family enzyme
MRRNKVKYHMMAEVDQKGAKAVLDRALQELKDGPEYIFISVDTFSKRII